MMLQDITNSLSTNNAEAVSPSITTDNVEYVDTVDYTPYMGLEPLLVYEHYNTVRVGIMTGTNSKGDIKVRKQGVRNGVDGYSARGTIPGRSLVPILCFVEEELVDKMSLHPAALGMGAALLRTTGGESDLANRYATLVDTVVEQYEESAPIEDSFFLPDTHTDDNLNTNPLHPTTTANDADVVLLGGLLTEDDDTPMLEYNPEVYGMAS